MKKILTDLNIDGKILAEGSSEFSLNNSEDNSITIQQLYNRVESKLTQVSNIESYSGNADLIQYIGTTNNAFTYGYVYKRSGNSWVQTNVQPATSIDSSLSSTSENPVQNKVIYSALDDKVDKVSGKGLSTEDYTTAEKTKLSGIETGAQVNVQPDWNQTVTTEDDYIKNKPTIPVVNDGGLLIQRNGVNVEYFSANEDTNKIANIIVPTKTSDLTNDGEGDTEEDANHELQPIKFITKLVNNLQYYYTKTEIDALMAPNLRFQVVQSLPTTNISPTTIYLLPNNVGESTNVYDEYIYISTAQTPYWELIGSTRVDMSLYQTIALSSAIVVDGVSQTTVENTLRALNTLLNGHTHSYNDLTNKPTIPTITFRQWSTT